VKFGVTIVSSRFAVDLVGLGRLAISSPEQARPVLTGCAEFIKSFH
jgi:hypothetical protein